MLWSSASEIPRGWPRIAMGLGCAAALTLARTLATARLWDIPFDDEALYLQSGLDFFRTGPPAAEWAPLYALWYWMESLWFRDPITLYYANWGLLMFANLLAFWFALTAAGVGPVAGALALSLASLLGYFEVELQVPLLAGALVLAAVATALRTTSPARALSTASTILAVAVFVRPELLLTYALCLAAAMFASGREHRYRWLITPIVTFGVLWGVFGTPFGRDRVIEAFGQHYALNVVTARHLTIDSWNNWELFFRADFGRSQTIAAALVENPERFVWHVAVNVRGLVRNGALVMPYLPSSPDVRKLLGVPVAVLLIAGVLRGLTHVRQDARVRRLLLMSGALLMPWVLTATIVWPRPRYFVPAIAALVVLAAIGLSRPPIAKARPWMLAGVPLTLLIIGWTTWLRGPIARPGLETVRLLRTVAAQRDVVILEPDFGRGLFAQLRYERLSQLDCIPFSSCLQTRRPDLVVSDERLRGHYVGDAGFRTFTLDPNAHGFEDTIVPGTDIHIYIRQAQNAKD